jgi:hypothetical protein
MLGEEQGKWLIYNNLQSYNILQIFLLMTEKRWITYESQTYIIICTSTGVGNYRSAPNQLLFWGPNTIIQTRQPVAELCVSRR